MMSSFERLTAADREWPALPAQVHAFEAILALLLTAEYWDRAIKHWHELDAFLVGSATLITALTGLILLGRHRQLAFAGLSVTVTALLVVIFPSGGNHEYLELLLCLLCTCVDTRRESERLLLVSAVRWMTCVILFWAGVQKLAHGYYFYGEYLAYSVSRETYRNVFSWLLPADELARLASYDGSANTGPYRTDNVPFLIVSNLSCILEIALVPFLLWPRTRRLAVAGAFALLAVIESAAREMFFFFVLANMLLLFLESDLNRKLIAPIALALASMLLIRMGVLPEVTFR